MNQLEKQVLELIGDDPDAPDVFKDTDLGMAPVRDSLNDAIQEISILTGSYRRQYFVPLRQDVTFYRFRLDNGFLGWVTGAWLVNQQRRLNQTDLIRLNADDPRWMVTSASPRSYFQIGHEIIGVYPKPSGDSDMLELNLVEIPAPYTNDADRIKLRKDFQYAAVNYAVSEYWASRGDVQEALKHWGRYLDTLGLRNQFDQSPHFPQRLKTTKGQAPEVTT